MNNDYSELLKKYLRNRYSDEELILIMEWFEKFAEKPESREFLLKIWEEIPEHDEEFILNPGLILDRIHHQINLDKSKILSKKGNHDSMLNWKNEMIRIISRAALILFIPVFTFGLFMYIKFNSFKNEQSFANQAYNEVFSSVDAITKVTLPDGTFVWLNHNSELKYPSSFRGGSRIVELKGEGFFDVTRNSRIPFIVKTGDIQILATGTTFNILAYPEENRIETSLIEGKVELQKLVQNGKPIPLIEMNPSDWVVYRKDNKRIKKCIIKDDRYFSWKEGKLIFRNESSDVIAEKLARWFNVDIMIDDPALTDLTFTGTFIDETLPQVLELLVKVSPISYSISERKKMSDGTFSRRKVTLYHRDNK